MVMIFLAGALGALCKDIFKDNTIEMPKWNEGKLGLGCIGGMIIGGAAGMYIDGSFITAFMAGFTGIAILQGVMDGKNVETTGSNTTNKTLVEGIIRYVAKQETVDPELAVRVAKCESALSPTAKNVNKDGSIDRGLFQINDKYHPEVCDNDAYDIVLSTRFFCKAVKENHLSWWDASKKCWECGNT